MTLVLGGLFIVLGIVGCILPALPGPPLAYCSLWVAFLLTGSVSVSDLVTGGVLAFLAVLFDYFLPAWCARRFNCSKSGVVGCLLGTLAGLFFMPLGLVVGPFLGTVVGELTVGKKLADAAHGGLGALLGFLGGVVFKLVVVGVIAVLFVRSL